MNTDVPYMPSVKNLHSILDAIQNAGAPEAFGLDFLQDLGFTSSNDRAAIKVLKFLGMLDAGGKPQASYREFMDHTRAKSVLAARMLGAYDDLFLADKKAHEKGTEALKGWFKTKTGASDAVAKKMATTFKSLATYADFADVEPAKDQVDEAPSDREDRTDESDKIPPRGSGDESPPPLGLTYRIEINLPDTTNVDTYRAIFRAIREELMV